MAQDGRGEIRIVHLSDTHLGFDLPVRPRTERPRRGEDFFANTKRALDYARAVCADVVIHTGDVFFRSRVPPAIVDRAYALFVSAVEHGPPLVIVPGNHERSRLPASLLLAHPRIHVLDRPRAVRFRAGNGFQGAICEVVGFPYHPEAGLRLGAFLDEAGMRGADVRVLALHQALEGARVGPAEFTFSRRDADVIRRDSVPPSVDLVLAGHVHRRQVLGLGPTRDIPGVHVGSIERTSYAEAPETKGFYDIRIRPDRPPEERVALRFKPLPARPLIEVDLREELSAEAARARALKAVRAAPARGVVRIRVAEGLLGAVTTTELRQAAREAPGQDDLIVAVAPAFGAPALAEAAAEE